MKAFALPILLGLAGLATARTDLSGCVSSRTYDQWHEASMIWYVPDSGEICDFVDCGGGRAPPKTNQPGCPLYSGTATLTPSYLPGYGPNGKMAATTTTASETATATDADSTSEASSHASTSSLSSSGSLVTPAPSSSPIVSMTTSTSTSSGSAAGNSTSAAPSSTATGNAATAPGFNVAGAMAIAAAVVGAVAL
ncbi:uncharacterized protein N7459_010042 [Penicillium hispanicum]|uniref:uncharacterized protein n=1 Tax=Penicillium hispanicum TaxID=1080232 RepID=UPI0025422F31|nr:uncharacterized protein N7459_010042 [Penicillium hispanicum]KAJ5570612.1 hypothetical protein N7459_010042 [Penicillium hispanicum]